MPKVTVIVPVYNTEIYVECAIVSLMEQTLSDVEFIIIDDGSQDDSLNIIRNVISRYPHRREQTILLSRTNSGVAAVRAEGMKLATGDYIIHLDSDDWVDLNWLELLYEKAICDDAEVVICNYRMIYRNKIVEKSNSFSNDNIICIKNMLTGTMSSMNWDKLIKRSFLINNNIEFKCDLDMGEDFWFNLQVFKSVHRLSFINAALYNYNQINNNSLTKRFTNKSLMNLVYVVNHANCFFNDNNISHLVEKEFSIYKLNVKAAFIRHSQGDINVKMYGLSLFKESDCYINELNVSFIIKIEYYMRLFKLTRMHFIIDFLYYLYMKIIK
jgi:glycosyltransferase involved in cell wall biosynthesis